MRDERSRRPTSAGHARPTAADFAEYRRTRDPRLRDRIAEAHSHLAYAIARRYAGRGEEMDELTQVALIALAQAIERFDPARGTAFSTFATPTIAGTLKRHFRDHTWAVRPPRGVQERYLAVAATVERLTSELCRKPTVAEVAADGRWTEREVEEALLAAVTHRWHEQWATGWPDEPEIGVADSALSGVEDRMVIEELLAVLERRDRQIVELRFYDELTQSNIARRVGVSQMHVSRLLTDSLDTLRRAAAERMLRSSP